ncbi:MAG: efflux RND transporter permease subunit [Deltaproteobacteria bacterium]|nr:efflux RND transporter permease subunit [Deltaproteobacteria bacterium]
MFLSDLSIKRPVFAAVLMLALVTLGISSYRKLAIDMYPDVEIPVIMIFTKYSGASPEAVEREVTRHIEEAVNPIAGVKHVTSYSREGVSTVVVQFQLEVKTNEATQEARAKISSIRSLLPQEIDEPIIQKIDFQAMPIVSLAVRSTTLSPRDLTTLTEKKVKNHLENLSGVGKVSLVGSSKREVSVDLNPVQLEALSMGVDEVIAGIQSENVNTPLGRFTGGGSEYPIRISGKPSEVDEFNHMVIAMRGSRPVTLADVAEIKDGIEEQRSLAYHNGLPAIGLDIMKQTGANTVEVVEAVKKRVKSLQAQMPDGTSIEVVRDGSIEIRNSVDDVKKTMVEGGILTVFIVFLFLNSWRSTVITGLTLPISVISSFIIMNAMGMTLNILTLMALSLAIGLLIDDAIVVRENIVRHLEKGKEHFTAARDGTNEIGLAVIATTFSIMAVFIPVAYMKGIIGRFFFHFGITVAFAVLVSLVVSFTLDPMLSSRWLDPDIHRRGRRHFIARLLDRFNDWFDKIGDMYKGIIGWSLDHRRATLGVAAIAFILGLVTFGFLESSFIPPFDHGEFQINFQTAPHASLEETRSRLMVVLDKLKEIPEIDHTYSTIGAGDSGTVRDARVYVKLVPKRERRKSETQIKSQVREMVQGIPGIIPSIIRANETRGELEVNIRGEEIALLKKYAAELKAEMYKIPGLVDLEVSLEHDSPEYRLTVDRKRSLDTGINSQRIVRTLGVLVGGQAVSTYDDEDGDAVDVRVRMPSELRRELGQLDRLRLAVPKAEGPSALVPLKEVVTYNLSATPTEINRQDLVRQVRIKLNLDNLALGTAMAKVRAATEKIPMLPGYQVIFSGEAEDMTETFQYMLEALILAVVFVYLILAAQFESFIEPLSIMLSLPLAVVGMAVLLFLTKDTVSIISLIGLIMLMGLVTKNAILLVDYTKILRAGGMPRREALILAGRTRFRPIMMTTLAMIFGMLPLSLGLGEGAEMRAPMARSVIGGLVTSTLLTLVVVPSVYTVLDDLGAWIRRRWEGAPKETSPTEHDKLTA